MSRVRDWQMAVELVAVRSRHCEPWASAMLRELTSQLDGQLFWALGSVAAIFRQWARTGADRFGKMRMRGEGDGKNVGWVFLGVVMAVLLVVCDGAVQSGGVFLSAHAAKRAVADVAGGLSVAGDTFCGWYGALMAQEEADGGRDSAGGGDLCHAFCYAHCEPLQRLGTHLFGCAQGGC